MQQLSNKCKLFWQQQQSSKRFHLIQNTTPHVFFCHLARQNFGFLTKNFDKNSNINQSTSISPLQASYQTQRGRMMIQHLQHQQLCPLFMSNFHLLMMMMPSNMVTLWPLLSRSSLSQTMRPLSLLTIPRQNCCIGIAR